MSARQGERVTVRPVLRSFGPSVSFTIGVVEGLVVFSVLGKITKRLLEQHGSGSSGWNPPRPEKGASGKSRGKAIGTPLGRGAGRKKGDKA